MNFFVKIAKKGGMLVHKYPNDDVAGEPRWRLTWRAGPPRRYDVALSPRGRTRVAHAEGARGAPNGKEAMRPRGRPCGAPCVAD